MNWDRGLFRLWLVGSIIWVTIAFFYMRPDQSWSRYVREQARIEMSSEQSARGSKDDEKPPSLGKSLIASLMPRPEYFRKRALTEFSIVFFPPIAGLLGIWVVHGFRGERR